MSTAKRLANLEAQAFANTRIITNLSRRNQELKSENAQKVELIARYKTDFKSDSNLHQELPNIMFAHPGPCASPYYVAARQAPGLHLGFVVSGMKGETLPFEVDVHDLAWILARTLERNGWREDTVEKNVWEFLEIPMVRVEWMGNDGRGRFGVLGRRSWK